MFGRSYEQGLTSDNVHYAAISKSLLSSDNPLLLTLYGEPYLNKPPLFFWLNSLAIGLFGSNTYGAKFVSISAAIIIMLVIFRVSCKAFNDVNVGYGAVLFFLLNYVVFKNSQACRIESLLTLFMMLSLIAGYKYITLRSLKYLVAAGLCSGLAVLTKGLVGAFPFAFLLIYLIITELKNNPKRLFFDMLVSIVVFVVSFAWWYAYAFAKTDLYNIMIINENLNRVVDVKGLKLYKSSVFKYMHSLLVYSLPLMVFFFIGYKRRISGLWQQRYVKYLTIFVAIYFIAIHFISIKYSRYYYPILPWLSIVAGVGLVSVTKYELRKVVVGITIAFAFMMVLYPGNTGQPAYNELIRLKPYVEKNNLSVCVDELYFKKWEPKSGILFYYGDDFHVGDCENYDVKILPSKSLCDGKVFINNRKIEVCVK